MMRVDESASVFLHRQPVDFRKQINGLALIVESGLGQTFQHPSENQLHAVQNLYATSLRIEVTMTSTLPA